MEFDESHEIVTALAEEMVSVASKFSEVPRIQISIRAALHLIPGIEIDEFFANDLTDACAAIEESLATLDITRLNFEFITKLREAIWKNDIRARDLRLRLATYLIDTYIMESYEIPVGQPKAVAAVVGSIHATQRFPVIELAPTTAEIPLGMTYDDELSYRMVAPKSLILKNLISIKLIINNRSPYFIENHLRDISFRHRPSFVFESREHTDALEEGEIAEFFDFTLDDRNSGRFILVIPLVGAKLGALTEKFSGEVENDLSLDALIRLSVSDGKRANDDRLLLVFSRGVHPRVDSRVYIDVSTSNKALEHLDLQEKAILAGHIINIHEGRALQVKSIVLPHKVLTIINAQFSDRYVDVKSLCVEEKTGIDRPFKIQSPKTFISRKQKKANVFNSTADPRAILGLLEDASIPACIYIIGNNGSGKTRLLCELIGRIRDLDRKTVGISTAVHDRFPFEGNKKSNLFKYMGARTSSEAISPSKLMKNVTSLVAKVLVDQGMLEALKECQQCLGFAPRFYFTLRAEMALGSSPNQIRPIRMSDNAVENEIPMPLANYEFGIVPLETAEQRERIVSYSSLSSGEQNVNQLLLNIITTAERGTVFLIDEPEISLHLKWQQTLPRVFHLLSRRFQCSFVVATHAPTLVSNANDKGSHSFMLSTGTLHELSATERYSVESIILDGFGIYTPHNRAVHEACARIVAMTMESEKMRRSSEIGPLSKLDEMKEKLEFQRRTYLPPGLDQDLDLIEKTQEAIKLLIADQSARDSDNSGEGAVDA